MRNVKQKVSLDSVPTRIVTRYKENFNYLLNQFKSVIKSIKGQGGTAFKETLNNVFGFKKVFLMLTEVGRLVAVSSQDGSIQWTEYLGGNV